MADSNKTESEPKVLDTEGAAAVLGVKVGTLGSWRCRGMGPPYMKYGGEGKTAVRYSRKALEDWMKSWEVIPQEKFNLKGPGGRAAEGRSKKLSVKSGA